MRLSTAPFTGTVSAAAFRSDNNAQPANAAAAHARRERPARFLLLMVRLLRSRLFHQNLRFGSKIGDLEAEWIPTARLRVLGGVRIGVLNGRNPVCVRLLGSGALAHRFLVPDLCQIGQSAGARKEAHRIDLDTDRT